MDKNINKIKFDKGLVRLVSYLTFDGHLAEDLKCFYLSSKNKESLLDFKNTVYKKFRVEGRLEEKSGYGESNKYRVFKVDTCKFLEKIGVPKGNKVAKNFLIPSWIKNNKEFSREYLRTAFDCEGSIWFEKQPKIRFGIFKVEELLDNCSEFIEDMRLMLNKFDINCTNAWLMKGNKRKDGKITKGLYFKIKQDSIKRFAREIGFTDKFKKQRLSSI